MKLRIFTLLLTTASAALAQSTINTTDHFAYGANVGWCDFRPSAGVGAVLGEYVCSGSLYAANIGWISLGSGAPANQVQYKNKSATDVTYTVEWTDNLTTWSTAGVTSSLLSDNGTTQQIKATVPAGANGRRFVRLKVTRP